MIIVCKSCRASFLVPSSSFAGGARTVRCGRCKSEWREVPHAKGGAVAQPTQTGQKSSLSSAEQSTVPSPLSHDFAQALRETAPDFVPEADQEEAQIETPAIDWKAKLKLLKTVTGISLLAIFGFVLFSIVVLIVGHSFIIKHWPETQSAYIAVGLATDPMNDRLILRNIASERRYVDGAMQLAISGEIFSKAQKRQVIPHLFVEAVGPDGRIIESWRIDPPQATIDPAKAVPFASSVLSPQETAVEVNLSFVEPPHDDE